MKRYKVFLVKNSMYISSGLILTAIFVRAAYEKRGCIAFGGEWLVVPVLMMAKYLFRSVKREISGWLESTQN